jgi:hypothetical protein
MNSILYSFRDCGWTAWLCLLIGLIGLACAGLGVALGAFRKRTAAQILGGMAVALGLTAAGMGVVGRTLAESKVESVLVGSSIDPSQKERIRAEGMREASVCVAVGAGTGALPFLLGVLALGLGLALQKPAAS